MTLEHQATHKLRHSDILYKFNHRGAFKLIDGKWYRSNIDRRELVKIGTFEKSGSKFD